MVRYRGPQAKVFIERGRGVASLSHTLGYLSVVERDTAVCDVDGNRCPDFSGGVAATSIGHSHSEVVRAIRNQAERRVNMSGADLAPATR